MGVQGDGARDAKPRTAVANRHGRWGAGCQATHRAMRRGGAMGTSRPTATGHEGVARQRGTKGEGIGAVRTAGYGVFAG